MKVSVIIPAYNTEKYIKRCLNSATNQTLKDIEIIVVNDGSTDNTLDMIKRLSKKDSRIIVLNQENKGAIEARKSGLKISQGEYILFIDSDDWLELKSLEILYENAKLNNSDIVVYNAVKVVENKKVVLNEFLNSKKEYTLDDVFLRRLSPSLWSKFIRSDFIKSNDIQFPTDISYAEDLATVASLLLFNPIISVEESILYNYFTRNESTTNNITHKVLEINKAFDFIETLLKENNLLKKHRDEFEYSIYLNLFEEKFLWYVDKEKKYNPLLYKQFKYRKINITNNPYIVKRIKSYSFTSKIRVYAYINSYRLGKCYDQLRLLVKRG